MSNQDDQVNIQNEHWDITKSGKLCIRDLSDNSFALIPPSREVNERITMCVNTCRPLGADPAAVISRVMVTLQHLHELRCLEHPFNDPVSAEIRAALVALGAK